MNKAQLRQLKELRLDEGYPVQRSTIELYSKVKPDEQQFRIGLHDKYWVGMMLAQQDTFLISHIRYRVLGKKFNGMNNLKRGLLSLSINNLIIFNMPIQWAARTHRGLVVTPNILLRGTQNNRLDALLENPAQEKIPEDCELAVQLVGHLILNSSVVY